MIGEVIGNYRVTAKLGAGGMGEVYRAEHVLIGRQAALKVLLSEFSGNKNIVTRFFNEARAASAIRHPGIVEILDFGYHGDSSAYILMEFLDGESLRDRLGRMKVLPLDMALYLMRQVAGALGAAHEQGIVHRDLKPDNIIVVADPEVSSGERIKILDFGIAKLAGSETSGIKTRTGMVMGTPAYMAPEQCKGAGQVDSRADLYSLGCIGFRMLCGKPPFTAQGGGEVLAQHIFSQPPSPTSLAPGLPPQVDALLLELLAKDPGDRPQTAADVIARLDAVLLQSGGRLPTSPSSPAMSQVPPDQTTISGGAGAVSQPAGGEASGRRWLVRGAAALATALVAVVTVVALTGSDAGEPSPADPEPAREASGEPAQPAAPAPDTAAAEAPAETPGAADDPPEAARAEPVSMTIESKPAAEVYSGGERLGTTPHTVELAAGAEQAYVLKREGYDDATVHLPADADAAGTVAIDLEPAEGEAAKRRRRASGGRAGKPSNARTKKRKRPDKKRKRGGKKPRRGGELHEGGSLPF